MTAGNPVERRDVVIVIGRNVVSGVPAWTAVSQLPETRVELAVRPSGGRCCSSTREPAEHAHRDQPPEPLAVPGRRAGQPIHPTTIAKHLGDLGLHLANARTSAIRQLALQAPAPVVAGMLGYSNESVAQIAAEAAGPWSRYAPGNHER
jgi:hypothetical protein